MDNITPTLGSLLQEALASENIGEWRPSFEEWLELERESPTPADDPTEEDDRVYDPESGEWGWYGYGGFTTAMPNWDGRDQ